MKRKADFIMQNVGGENLLVPLGAQVMDLNGLVILNDTAPACGTCWPRIARPTNWQAPWRSSSTWTRQLLRLMCKPSWTRLRGWGCWKNDDPPHRLRPTRA